MSRKPWFWCIEESWFLSSIILAWNLVGNGFASPYSQFSSLPVHCSVTRIARQTRPDNTRIHHNILDCNATETKLHVVRINQGDPALRAAEGTWEKWSGCVRWGQKDIDHTTTREAASIPQLLTHIHKHTLFLQHSKTRNTTHHLVSFLALSILRQRSHGMLPEGLLSTVLTRAGSSRMYRFRSIQGKGRERCAYHQG